MISCAALLTITFFDAPASTQKRVPQALPSRRIVSSTVPMGATLFPLDSMRLLDDPFKRAQETDRAYYRYTAPSDAAVPSKGTGIEPSTAPNKASKQEASK